DRIGMELVRPNHLLQADVRIRSAQRAGECAGLIYLRIWRDHKRVSGCRNTHDAQDNDQLCRGHDEAFSREIDYILALLAPTSPADANVLPFTTTRRTGVAYLQD